MSREQGIGNRVDFDSKLALETINNGFSVACFWSDRIYQRLQENLGNYAR
ncbi:MAG: hypothetical protein V7L05_26080 [Nostoc sp.]